MGAIEVMLIAGAAFALVYLLDALVK